MQDLSHWDFTDRFLGSDAAALMLGLDPRKLGDDEHRAQVVADRLKLDYEQTVDQVVWLTADTRPGVAPTRPAVLLCSMALEQLWREDSDSTDEALGRWAFNQHKTLFENQFFSRQALAAWLKDSGMKSAYRFDRAAPTESETGEHAYIDPADYPEHLQAANVAFRAVSNGFGDPSATFRNRLIEYLKQTYPDLQDGTIEHIATVANPEKTRGRRKRHL